MDGRALHPPLDVELGHLDTIPLIQLPETTNAQTHPSKLLSDTDNAAAAIKDKRADLNARS